MSKVHLISIDPGERYTGIMICTTPLQLDKHKIISEKVENNVKNYRDEIIKVIEDSIIMARNLLDLSTVLIIEDFILYQHKAAVQSFERMRTSELIGSIKLYFSNFKGVTIVIQTASQAKTWTDDRLVRLGILNEKNGRFYSPTTSLIVRRHTRDALRHMVYWLNKNKFDKCITKELYEGYFRRRKIWIKNY